MKNLRITDGILQMIIPNRRPGKGCINQIAGDRIHPLQKVFGLKLIIRLQPIQLGTSKLQ